MSQEPSKRRHLRAVAGNGNGKRGVPRRMYGMNPPEPSPAEQAFLDAYKRHQPYSLRYLVREYSVPSTRYRVDFAVPQIMVAIEIDSRMWHAGREDYDAARIRHIEMLGWCHVPLTAREVLSDAGGCVDDVAEIAAVWEARWDQNAA